MAGSTGIPNFAAFDDAERKALRARLEAVREVLSHRGEEGRSLEKEVMAFLRTFLPKEYGLSTGFIAYHGPKGPELSSQLDIIIYDAIRCAPIASLDACDVFPLEAVYGYVEVKACLRTDDGETPHHSSLEYCVLQSAQLRKMTECRFWAPIQGKRTEMGLLKENRLPIRSYVFAFEFNRPTVDPNELARLMSDAAERFGPEAHLHGVYLDNVGFFSTYAVESPDDPRYHNTAVQIEHPLSHFKWALLCGLARFSRLPLTWTPAIDQYRLLSAKPTAVVPPSGTPET